MKPTEPNHISSYCPEGTGLQFIRDAEQTINSLNKHIKNTAMGLDTTHGAWSGPYSSFNHFRYWLGDRIGISLKEYNGYDGTNGKDLVTINHPLMALFDHSDCDGTLTPDECKTIAEGLDLVIKAVVPDTDPFGNYQKAIQFRNGCLDAFEKGETLEFR